MTTQLVWTSVPTEKDLLSCFVFVFVLVFVFNLFVFFVQHYLMLIYYFFGD